MITSTRVHTSFIGISPQEVEVAVDIYSNPICRTRVATARVYILLDEDVVLGGCLSQCKKTISDIRIYKFMYLCRYISVIQI